MYHNNTYKQGIFDNKMTYVYLLRLSSPRGVDVSDELKGVRDLYYATSLLPPSSASSLDNPVLHELNFRSEGKHDWASVQHSIDRLRASNLKLSALIRTG